MKCKSRLVKTNVCLCYERTSGGGSHDQGGNSFDSLRTLSAFSVVTHTFKGQLLLMGSKDKLKKHTELVEAI